MAAEKQFEQKVKEFLKKNGCWVLKTWSNGVQRDGVPDLLVCCNGFFMGIELKAEHGKPSALQLWNIDQIRKSGGIAFVLYPHQFRDFQYLIEHMIHDRDVIARSIQYTFDRKDENDESL